MKKEALTAPPHAQKSRNNLRFLGEAVNRIILIVSPWLLLFTGAGWAQAQSPMLRADDANFAQKAKATPMGKSLSISEVSLDPFQPTRTMHLQRFNVFTNDAKIVINSDQGQSLLPIPRNSYFFGTIEGQPNAKVYLNVLEDGTTRGLIVDRGRFWIAAGGSDSGGPVNGFAAREVNAMDLEFLSRSIDCESDTLSGERLPLTKSKNVVHPPRDFTDASFTAASYNARIAIETDFEFYQRFGNETAASNYAADLIAFSSITYSDEIDTALSISHINIWTTSSDPWSQNSTLCGLFEFGRYWNDNHSGIERTLAHFLSGKNNGGGVAWVGVLCRSGFTYNHQGNCPSLSPQTDNYGGGYGYSGDLDGNFNINNPSVVWDVVVTAHELGHNFNSPHTHCYGGIGGNNNPVDTCNAGQCGQTGCHCGATGLPCGTAGAGCGTIMSYCHLLGGGISNISMTFGQDHPHGTAPDRVPNRMSAAVVSANSSQPNCLPENASSLGDLLDQWPGTVSVIELIGAVNP